MAIHEVDPVSRIEGHLGVKVTTDASGNITDALAHGNLWRGFENFLLGRTPNDAITFTQRICGVCPVPHGQTSTYAADTVLGYSRGHITFKQAVEPIGTIVGSTATTSAQTFGIPAKAVLIRNLVQSAEFLMSSITHFYHLAAPSYVQGPAIPPWTPYFDDTYYAGPLLNKDNAATPMVPVAGTAHTWAADGSNRDVWDAVIISYVRALRIRRLTFEAGALFAGRMPMTSCYCAGGVTNDPNDEHLVEKIAAFKGIIREVGLFIVNEYVPIALVLGLLYPTYDSNNADGTMKPASRGIGAGIGRFLSWGGFPQLDDTLAVPGGVKDVSTPANDFTVVNKAEVYSKWLAGGSHSVPANLTEDISNSHYGVADMDTAAYAAHAGVAAYPGAVKRTKPARESGYSYIKAPRWNGLACEVGPLARLAVAGIYPVTGTTLTTIPGYVSVYTNAGALDTRVIAPTIVAALANAGLVSAVQGWILGLKGGLSTMDRLRARAIESLVLVQKMVGSVSKAADGTLSFGSDGWIDDPALLATAVGSTCRTIPVPVGTVQGWGANEAPRGALMHQETSTGGKIAAYQCIVPTTWNGSPKDAASNHGAIESAMIGQSTGDKVPFSAAGATFTNQAGNPQSTQGGVEVLRIAQSFDPCIACAVH